MPSSSQESQHPEAEGIHTCKLPRRQALISSPGQKRQGKERFYFKKVSFMDSFVFNPGLVLHFKNKSTNKLKQMFLCQISLSLSPSLTHPLLCSTTVFLLNFILYHPLLSNPSPFLCGFMLLASPSSAISPLLHFQFYNFNSFFFF